MTRREFVIGGSAAALSGCVTGTDGSRLRIGVLSDIHLSIPELISDEHDKDVCRTTPVMFERALRYFRERGEANDRRGGSPLGLIKRLAILASAIVIVAVVLRNAV